MQRARRHDPHPTPWEVPLAIVVGSLLLVVVGAHLGRGIANLLSAGWWDFPDRADWFTSIPGLLEGDASAGLTATHAAVAAATLLWICIAAVELAILGLIVAGIRSGLRLWGPSRVQGVATREEAERLLGRSRLRRHAAVVRPDLYGKGRGQA
jgi:hypothetical protein